MNKINASDAIHIQVRQVCKNYDEHQVRALIDVSLQIRCGEFVALTGPSGCGKSTLLNMIAGIDKPSSGSILIGEQEVSALDDKHLTELRRDKIGFVFQFFNLLNTLTVFENASLPLSLAGRRTSKDIRKRTEEMLEKVGLSHRRDFYPSQLSGGEMQRVAIARALVHEPAVIVADEPTGNLDSENGEQVLKLFQKLCREGMHTTLMATHSAEAANFADRTIKMRDGRVLEEVFK